jgi:hypothetical protein
MSVISEWRKREVNEYVCSGDKIWNSTTLPFNPDEAITTSHKTEWKLQIKSWWTTAYYTKVYTHPDNKFNEDPIPLNIEKITQLSLKIKQLSAELEAELAKNKTNPIDERRLDPDL